MTGKFIRNIKYYTGIVYEWNLPAGHTCPFAKECKVLVDQETGKYTREGAGSFRCYASSAERFPAVRKHRWSNYNFILSGGVPVIPDKCKHVRIHASGDFFSQDYFNTWIQICKDNLDIEFWAFTKSIRFWVDRLSYIPFNLTLTASYGGADDALIKKYNLKNTRVFQSREEAGDLPINTNDDYARIKQINFALLDNNRRLK